MVPLELALPPMMIFSIGIDLANLMAVQRALDADARQCRRNDRQKRWLSGLGRLLVERPARSSPPPKPLIPQGGDRAREAGTSGGGPCQPSRKPVPRLMSKPEP